MVEKVEGAEMKCLSCDVKLICRKKIYKAYKDKPEREVLQWQHAPDKAHYKWVADGKYDCVSEPLPIGTIDTTSNVEEGNVNPNHDTLIALNLKVDTIYAMISEIHSDYIKRKEDSEWS